MEHQMKTYIMYEITCLDKSITSNYIGSTINFTRRKCQHKKDCANENRKQYNQKIYKNIRDIGGWNNWIMLPLEEFECESILQAHIREQYWIDLKEAKLNSRKAHTTREQTNVEQKEQKVIYYIENKNEILAKSKQKYSENREEVSEKRKIKFTCECGSNTRKSDKAVHVKSQKHINYISNLLE